MVVLDVLSKVNILKKFGCRGCLARHLNLGSLLQCLLYHSSEAAVAHHAYVELGG